MSLAYVVPLIRDSRGCVIASCVPIIKPPTIYTSRDYTCATCTDLTAAAEKPVQKRILKTVRLASSDYTHSLAPQHVYDASPSVSGQLPWHNTSDRMVAGVVHAVVPSRGASSTRSSVTRARPGACSAPGRGVDVKHGSYDRYLAKLKGRTVGRTCIDAGAGAGAGAGAVAPLRGNKTQYFSVSNADTCSYPATVYG
jgi:hypothetical protein